MSVPRKHHGPGTTEESENAGRKERMNERENEIPSLLGELPEHHTLRVLRTEEVDTRLSKDPPNRTETSAHNLVHGKR